MVNRFASFRSEKPCYQGLICWFVLLMALHALTGCAEKTVQSPSGLEPQPQIWESDEGPTIRWVKEIRSAGDAGLRESLLQRVQTFLFGGKEQSITRPYAVYAEDTQRLCVSDPGSGKFHLYDIQRGDYRVIDRDKQGRLSSPVGIAGDGKGTLYLTDSALGRVFRYDLNENQLELFTKEVLGRPTGIAFNPENWLLYVADTLAHQVVVFGLDGVERFRLGQRGSADGEFNFPTDLWIDGGGRLLVTDSLNARIQTFSSTGEFLGSLGTRGDASGFLDKPKGVATDSSGHVYIADALKDNVQVFTADGRYLMRFGERGQGEGQFWMPAGIFIDQQDRIYVADSYNQRIQVFEVVHAKE